jgi:acetylornithine deacetylase
VTAGRISNGYGRAMTELARLAEDLVAIDSVNPTLVPGSAGEGPLARHIAEWLERAGLEVTLQDAGAARINVVGVKRGSGGGRTLLLTGHTDTVAFADGQATEPRVDGGRLYGRGAYDMKGGVAAVMMAAASVRGLAGDVMVAAVVDEEAGSAGTRAFVAEHSADAALLTEPTELDIVVGHKGYVGFEVEVAGRAAHGSRPDLGIDAIARMGPIVVAIGELDQRLAAAPAHGLVGRASVHCSVIEGGIEFSTYPARCVLSGERRTMPGETRELVEGELRALIGADAQLRVPFAGEPFEIDPAHEIVSLTARHAGTSLIGVPYWTDAALLSAAGIPTVIFGPVGEGAHAEVEWVDLDSLERVRDVLVAVARDFCG